MIEGLPLRLPGEAPLRSASGGAPPPRPKLRHLGSNPMPQVLGANRPLEPETLARRAPEVDHQVEKLLVLHMFSDTRYAQDLAQADHRPKQSLPSALCRRLTSPPSSLIWSKLSSRK